MIERNLHGQPTIVSSVTFDLARRLPRILYDGVICRARKVMFI